MKIELEVIEGQAPVDQFGYIDNDVIIIGLNGSLHAVGNQNVMGGLCNCCSDNFPKHNRYILIPKNIKDCEVCDEH